MSQESIDTRALEVATTALTKIESHEKTCESRYKELASIHDSFRKEFRMFYVGVIIVLVGAFAYLWDKIY